MVVITGIGIVTALGIGQEANLQMLKSGRDGIVRDGESASVVKIQSPMGIESSRSVLNFLVGKVNYTNDELKKLLGINERETISRTTLLGMLACQEAINDAKLDPKNTVFINATTVGGMDLTPLFYEKFIGDEDFGGQLRYIVQHDPAAGTNMIANRCKIGGYSTTISTACSSSANAIMMGARLIESGLAETVITGGTDALSLFTLNGFKSLSILSNEKCRPFCNTRNGLNLGEGAAYLVLQKSESQTLTSRAKLIGYGNANDAFHQTAMTKEGKGATLAMKKALEKAQITPDEIDYVNVHGTATENNDASEAEAMKKIFSENIPDYSSTKAFTGHTLAAAGAIEVVYSILSIENNLIWPNLNFQETIPDFTSPVTKLTNKKADVVMSNSFGFGGNCTSLIFTK